MVKNVYKMKPVTLKKLAAFGAAHRMLGKITKKACKEPPYHRGDLLWVRETWGLHYGVVYADPDQVACPSGGWKPAVTMPRRFSRTTLKVLKVELNENKKHWDIYVDVL